jgi:hypothetical protein
LIDGLKKHELTLSSLFIGGALLKTADVIGILQARIDAASSAVSSRATWQTDVKADHDGRAKSKTFVSGLRQALQVAFVGQVDALAESDAAPRRKPPGAPGTQAEKHWEFERDGVRMRKSASSRAWTAVVQFDGADLSRAAEAR